MLKFCSFSTALSSRLLFARVSVCIAFGFIRQGRCVIPQLLKVAGLFGLLTLSWIIGMVGGDCREGMESVGNKNIKTEQSVRSFYMGFSPWPYDLTLEAVQWTDAAIKAHGDIIEQHFEEGVPWPEALANKPYDGAMQQEMADRSRRMGDYKRVVSINPINMARNGLADYRGKSCNMPLSGQWKKRRLNDPAVKQAYLQYCNQVIQSLRPDFLLIGVEVNLLQRCKDSSWQDYLELHRYIYGALKKSHPGLPVMASVVCTSYFPGLCSEDNAGDQRAKLKDLLPYVDVLGFSVHPFMSSWTAEKVPDQSFFRELFALAAGKPFAITESSYPAQPWQMQVGLWPVKFNGSQEKQAAFLKAMLDASLVCKPRFISWYSIRDYDQLCRKLPNIPLMIVWRDTGLFDENGQPRQALKIWDAVFKRRRQ